MAARIARLYAHNYRSFVNFELRPGRRSLLLGYNGSGKSSAFDVMDAIQDLVAVNMDATSAFPTDTLTKLSGSAEQKFELDIESERGTLRYALHLTHDLEKETVSIALEELSLAGTLAYRFVKGDVEIFGEGGDSVRAPFPFSPDRSPWHRWIRRATGHPSRTSRILLGAA